MKPKDRKAEEHLKLIGKGIKFWRKRHNWNQSTAALFFGCSRSYIAKVETAGTGISLKKIIEFSKLLKIQPATLMIGAPSQNYMNIINGFYTKYKMSNSQFERLYCMRPKNYIKPSREECLEILNIVLEKKYIFRN